MIDRRWMEALVKDRWIEKLSDPLMEGSIEGQMNDRRVDRRVDERMMNG